MTLLHRARTLAHRAGLDITRYPAEQPGHQLCRLLAHHQISDVIDVGANDGGYGRVLREFGYQGRIVSYEPVTTAFRRLQTVSGTDPLWQVRQFAVGAEKGTVRINVAGNAEASSSVLPMLDRHREAAPQAAYVRTEQVDQHRLDDLDAPPGAFLKIDVQGYEREVLRGAERTLPGLAGVQLELSFVPLYESGMLYREAFDRMADAGLTLMLLLPGFTDPASGQMLQADGVFFRAS